MYIRKNLQKKLTITGFLLPSLIGLFGFIFLPTIVTIVLSLTDYDVLQHTLPNILEGNGPDFTGLKNYANIIQSGNMMTSFRNTLLYMALYIPPVIIIALLLATLLAKDFKGVRIYQAIFYLPVVSSWVAVAVLWKVLLNGRWGMLNNILLLVGIDGPAWLTDRAWVFAGIAMSAIWKDVGYYVLIFLAGLKNIDKTYYEAARVDGSNRWQEFFRITLPLMTPYIFLAIVMNIIASFQVFESVAIMGDNLRSYTTVVVTSIYNYAFRTYQMGNAMALSVVLFIVLILITVIQFKLQKKWVHYDG